MLTLYNRPVAGYRDRCFFITIFRSCSNKSIYKYSEIYQDRYLPNRPVKTAVPTLLTPIIHYAAFCQIFIQRMFV